MKLWRIDLGKIVNPETAFLCREIDLLAIVAGRGLLVFVRGQFLLSQEMWDIARNLQHIGGEGTWPTEHGMTFGQDHMVVISDAGHKAQLSGAGETKMLG
jgi:3-deoxy-D-manno-octulosonic acid (KDO) 8-phosphate synthase